MRLWPKTSEAFQDLSEDDMCNLLKSLFQTCVRRDVAVQCGLCTLCLVGFKKETLLKHAFTYWPHHILVEILFYSSTGCDLFALLLDYQPIEGEILQKLMGDDELLSSLSISKHVMIFHRLLRVDPVSQVEIGPVLIWLSDVCMQQNIQLPSTELSKIPVCTTSSGVAVRGALLRLIFPSTELDSCEEPSCVKLAVLERIQARLYTVGDIQWMSIALKQDRLGKEGMRNWMRHLIDALCRSPLLEERIVAARGVMDVLPKCTKTAQEDVLLQRAYHQACALFVLDKEIVGFALMVSLSLHAINPFLEESYVCATAEFTALNGSSPATPLTLLVVLMRGGKTLSPRLFQWFVDMLDKDWFDEKDVFLHLLSLSLLLHRLGQHEKLLRTLCLRVDHLLQRYPFESEPMDQCRSLFKLEHAIRYGWTLSASFAKEALDLALAYQEDDLHKHMIGCLLSVVKNSLPC